MTRKLFQRLIHKIDRKEAMRGLAILLIYVIISVILSQTIGEERIALRVNKAGVRGPILLIFRKACTVVLIPFSGSLIYIIAGGIYGLRKGVVLGMIGNAIGMSIAFWIGRTRGTKAVQRIIGEKHIDEVLHLIGHLGNIKTFVLTRIILFPLEDFLNYASGMSKMRYGIYFILSMIITTLHSILWIFLGGFII